MREEILKYSRELCRRCIAERVADKYDDKDFNDDIFERDFARGILYCVGSRSPMNLYEPPRNDCKLQNEQIKHIAKG